MHIFGGIIAKGLREIFSKRSPPNINRSTLQHTKDSIPLLRIRIIFPFSSNSEGQDSPFEDFLAPNWRLGREIRLHVSWNALTSDPRGTPISRNVEIPSKTSRLLPNLLDFSRRQGQREGEQRRREVSRNAEAGARNSAHTEKKRERTWNAVGNCSWGRCRRGTMIR